MSCPYILMCKGEIVSTTGRRQRRSIRLPGFNYAHPGAYFVTICSYRRQHLFGEVIDGEVFLTDLGELAATWWKNIPMHFRHVSIDLFVVMPNHFHGILILEDPGRGTKYRAPTEGFGRPIKGSLPTIIRAYKATVTRD